MQKSPFRPGSSSSATSSFSTRSANNRGRGFLNKEREKQKEKEKEKEEEEKEKEKERRKKQRDRKEEQLASRASRERILRLAEKSRWNPHSLTREEKEDLWREQEYVRRKRQRLLEKKQKDLLQGIRDEQELKLIKRLKKKRLLARLAEEEEEEEEEEDEEEEEEEEDYESNVSSPGAARNSEFDAWGNDIPFPNNSNNNNNNNNSFSKPEDESDFEEWFNDIDEFCETEEERSSRFRGNSLGEEHLTEEDLQLLASYQNKLHQRKIFESMTCFTLSLVERAVDSSVCSGLVKEMIDQSVNSSEELSRKKRKEELEKMEREDIRSTSNAFQLLAAQLEDLKKESQEILEGERKVSKRSGRRLRELQSTLIEKERMKENDTASCPHCHRDFARVTSTTESQTDPLPSPRPNSSLDSKPVVSSPLSLSPKSPPLKNALSENEREESTLQPEAEREALEPSRDLLREDEEEEEEEERGKRKKEEEEEEERGKRKEEEEEEERKRAKEEGEREEQEREKENKSTIMSLMEEVKAGREQHRALEAEMVKVKELRRQEVSFRDVAITHLKNDLSESRRHLSQEIQLHQKLLHVHQQNELTFSDQLRELQQSSLLLQQKGEAELFEERQQRKEEASLQKVKHLQELNEWSNRFQLYKAQFVEKEEALTQQLRASTSYFEKTIAFEKAQLVQEYEAKLKVHSNEVEGELRSLIGKLREEKFEKEDVIDSLRRQLLDKTPAVGKSVSSTSNPNSNPNPNPSPNPNPIPNPNPNPNANPYFYPNSKTKPLLPHLETSSPRSPANVSPLENSLENEKITELGLLLEVPEPLSFSVPNLPSSEETSLLTKKIRAKSASTKRLPYNNNNNNNNNNITSANTATNATVSSKSSLRLQRHASFHGFHQPSALSPSPNNNNSNNNNNNPSTGKSNAEGGRGSRKEKRSHSLSSTHPNHETPVKLSPYLESTHLSRTPSEGFEPSDSHPSSNGPKLLKKRSFLSRPLLKLT